MGVNIVIQIAFSWISAAGAVYYDPLKILCCTRISLRIGRIFYNKLSQIYNTYRLEQIRHAYQNNSVAPQSPDNQLIKVVFFPDEKLLCKKLIDGGSCEDDRCNFGHNDTALSVVTRHLSSATRTIDICVFMISSQELADVILRIHQSGVVIRVVVDCEKMDLNCSQIEQFRADGIQVRHDKTSYFMHHKFCIIDRHVLINGSFNWTRQAITGNRENLMICDIPDIVRPYQEEFERLWKVYDPEADQRTMT